MLDRELYRSHVDYEVLTPHHKIIVNSDSIDENEWVEYLSLAGILDRKVIKLLTTISNQSSHIDDLESQLSAAHNTLSEVYNYGYCKIQQTVQQQPAQNCGEQSLEESLRGVSGSNQIEEPICESVSSCESGSSGVSQSPESDLFTGGETTPTGTGDPEMDDLLQQLEVAEHGLDQSVERFVRGQERLVESAHQLQKSHQEFEEQTIRTFKAIAETAYVAGGGSLGDDSESASFVDVFAVEVDTPRLHSGQEVPQTNPRRVGKPVLKTKSKSRKRRKGFGK